MSGPYIATDLREQIFRISMLWRILYGAVRVFFGLALLRMIGQPVLDALLIVMHHEMAQDPHDVLVAFLTRLLEHHPAQVTYFLASYFIFWGVVDIFLSISLLRHYLWAFPAGIALIMMFVGYELFRFLHTHSHFLLFVICVDIVIAYIVYLEYGRVRAAKSTELCDTG